MIKPERLTKAQLNDLHNRFHSTIFDAASNFNIWFDANEVKYIETKMQTHKLYRLVSGKAAGIDCHDIASLQFFKFQRDWLLGFTKDPNIPIGVQAFIYYYVGDVQQSMQQYNCVTEKMNTHDICLADRFLAQRWMETCR